MGIILISNHGRRLLAVVRVFVLYCILRLSRLPHALLSPVDIKTYTSFSFIGQRRILLEHSRLYDLSLSLIQSSNFKVSEFVIFEVGGILFFETNKRN